MESCLGVRERTRLSQKSSTKRWFMWGYTLGRNLSFDGSDAAKLDGVHVVFLLQVTGMLQAAGTKPLWDYIERRYATVAEWVDLQPIFEDYVKEMGYKGGRGLREQWWRQTATAQQLKTMLKEILLEAWERRRQ